MLQLARPLALAASCASAVLAAPPLAPAAQPEPDAGRVFRGLVEDVGPALVTVKFVLKFEASGEWAGMMGDAGHEMESTGVMIDPKGLVLMSNTQMGGMAMARGISATPTDVKVLIGEDTEGRSARILARDTELDLAWVQIEEPGDEPFKHVDFAGEVGEAQVGDRILVPNRMPKFYDRAIAVNEGRIAGKTIKPRPLLVPTISTFGQLGVPVFTADGRILGLTVIQTPDPEEAEGAGGIQDMMYSVSGLILPASEIVRATQRTRELAAPEEDR